jgi:hypothetical protein
MEFGTIMFGSNPDFGRIQLKLKFGRSESGRISFGSIPDFGRIKLELEFVRMPLKPDLGRTGL